MVMNSQLLKKLNWEKEDLIKVLVHATNIAQATLNTLTEVYTRKMIDDSKKELEDIKELVKEYNL